MTRAEEFRAVRLEMETSRARIRQREMAKPMRLLIVEMAGARQQRTTERQEAARRLWGQPPAGGLSRIGPPVGPRDRNARF
jgi:hypothetical protein